MERERAMQWGERKNFFCEFFNWKRFIECLCFSTHRDSPRSECEGEREREVNW